MAKTWDETLTKDARDPWLATTRRGKVAAGR